MRKTMDRKIRSRALNQAVCQHNKNGFQGDVLLEMSPKEGREKSNGEAEQTVQAVHRLCRTQRISWNLTPAANFTLSIEIVSSIDFHGVTYWNAVDAIQQRYMIRRLIAHTSLER